MNALWVAVGETLEPVLISVVTLAVVGLLRLVTPAVRWSRRLKHDADVLAALPEGKEKELWALSVTAQAERLRVYREDQSLLHRFVDVYLIVAVLAVGVMSVVEIAAGGVLAGGDWAPVVWVAIAICAIGFLTLMVRLVMGLPLRPGPGQGGHYPKYAALLAAERRRRYHRIAVEERLNDHFMQEHKTRRKAKRTPSAK